MNLQLYTVNLTNSVMVHNTVKGIVSYGILSKNFDSLMRYMFKQ